MHVPRRQPEWMDEARRHPRWADTRTVLAGVGGEEFLGKTRDISVGGAGVALVGARPRPGQTLELSVVFEQRVLALRGRVVHARRARWGSLVGVAWSADDKGVLAFLENRYGASSTAGSVK